MFLRRWGGGGGGGGGGEMITFTDKALTLFLKNPNLFSSFADFYRIFWGKIRIEKKLFRALNVKWPHCPENRRGGVGIDVIDRVFV